MSTPEEQLQWMRLKSRAVASAVFGRELGDAEVERVLELAQSEGVAARVHGVAARGGPGGNASDDLLVAITLAIADLERAEDPA